MDQVALLTPVETRWNSINKSLECLLKNKEYVQAAVFDKNMCNMPDLKKIKIQ